MTILMDDLIDDLLDRPRFRATGAMTRRESRGWRHASYRQAHRPAAEDPFLEVRVLLLAVAVVIGAYGVGEWMPEREAPPDPRAWVRAGR